MKTGFLTISMILLSFIAVTVASCNDDGSAANADFLGTWVREKTSTTSSYTYRDRWTLTINDDYTYKLLHEHTDNDGESPMTVVSSRQGEYDVDSDGIIAITGDWLDMTSDIKALSDLGDNFYTFTQTTMIAYDSQRDLLFFGPEFHEGSAYLQTMDEFAEDNYTLLFRSSDSEYRRTSAMVLTNTNGNTIEERTETFTYQIVDANDQCAGSFASRVTVDGKTEDISGTLENCTYVLTSDSQVQSVGGGTTTVSEVTFFYTRAGESVSESYLTLDDFFISFEIGDKATSIVDNAFIRSAK